ncbi:MAG: peptidoglycan DD-metalloendopeptidase family protein [bacterium]|nr:peptidoglycan DD-metalloendopeptidase family protein [bacterium]
MKRFKTYLYTLIFALTLVVFFASSHSESIAQTTGTGQSKYYLRGTVFGENFDTPLFAASVALVNKKTQGVENQKTSSGGEFAFIVPSGEYSLNVIARGYMPDTQTVSLNASPVTTYFILRKLQANPIVTGGPSSDDASSGSNADGTSNSSNGSTSTPGSSSNATVNADGTITSTSNCVVTIWGKPSASPPDCAPASGPSGGSVDGGPAGGSIGNGGKWIFPLKSIDEASGVATEMAVYAYGKSGGGWGGHFEHAGLDVGTGPGIWNEKPVYAITDGNIFERTDANCAALEAGCSVQIEHTTDKLISRYTHIDILGSIQLNQHVTKGTLLGHIHKWPCAAYESGVCVAANDHLHFELRRQDKVDGGGSPVVVNARNYYPELQRFGINDGYYGNVRSYTASQGLPWQDDGKEFGNEYKIHSPCGSDAGSSNWCWAH